MLLQRLLNNKIKCWQINKYLLKPLNFKTVQIAFFIVKDVLLAKLVHGNSGKEKCPYLSCKLVVNNDII